LLVITDNDAIKKYAERFERLWKGSGDGESIENRPENEE